MNRRKKIEWLKHIFAPNVWSIFTFYLLPFTFLLLPSSSSATHLMGGNLAYKYMGETFPGSEQYMYEITLVTFQDCSSPNWWSNGGGLPDGNARVGIFQGPAIPTSALPFVANLNLPLVDSGSVSPPLPNGCNIPDIPCVFQVTYRNTVTLPRSFLGYHVYYDRCCRNDSIVNLNSPGAQGMAFHAFISPSIVVNNSPVFTDMPVPFICVNDTTGILNTATDPDGDLLLFSFENPYEGEYTDQNNPTVQNYSSFAPINVPFPTVNWANGGFDKNNPFGPSGYAFINAFTGYSQYKPDAIGNYVIAVEIKEYRNGILIGITRRDMQLLVVNCPPNNTPALSASGGSGTTTYTIEEGQSLCFPITFTDQNTITVSSTGNIFNSSFTNPPATINTPVTGTGSATANFCWNTGCNQGQTLPYLFNAEATDNGCPPKTTPIVYAITINNFNGSGAITGINSVCPGISGLPYSISPVSGATYSWAVTGGTIVSGQGTTSIVVNWGNGPSGNVSTTITSQFGCPSNPVNLPVSFNATVEVLAGTDKTICQGDTVSIGGSPTAPSGTIVTWIPSSGLSNPNIQNPVASPNATTTYIATAANSSGCSDADTIVVLVNPKPSADAGNDTLICVNSSAQLNANPGGATYQWFPAAGLSCTNCQNPVAFPGDTTTYSVIITNSENCKDTDDITVFIITEMPADAGIDQTICAGDSVQIGGSMQIPLGATINWTPNSGLNNTSILNPKAAPLVTTTYTLTVIAGDCSGIDSVTITVNQLPLANAGNDTLICDGDTIQLSANTSATAAFQWFPASVLSNPSSQNPLAFPLSSTLFVFTATENNCSNSDSVFVQVFSSTVNVTADTAICFGDSIQLIATAAAAPTFLWSPSATLSADNISNPFAFPTGTTKYFVQATDTNSCSSIDSVIIYVNPLPVVDAGNAQSICFGDSAQLNATGGISYVWNPSGTLSNSGIANPHAFPTNTTTYLVTAIDSNNCANVDSVEIIVNSLPVAQAGNDTAVCENDTVQLTATSNVPSSFLWNTGDVSSSISLPLTSTSAFYVIITDANNCSDTDSVTVNVNILPFADAGNDEWLCPGNSIQLMAVSTATTFLWFPSATLNNPNISSPEAAPPDTTEYFVTVTDSNACKNIDSVTVFVNGIVPTDAGIDKFICRNDSAQIGASPTSPNGTVFSWIPIAGLNDSGTANPKASPNDTTMYYVFTTNDTCIGADSVQVIVLSLPIADAGADAEICIGDSAQLNAVGGLSFVWTPATTLTDDSIQNPKAFPDSTITYFVSVTDINNCSNNDSVKVVVNYLPAIDAGTDMEICLGDSAQLTATATAAATNFLWIPSVSLNNPAIDTPLAFPSDTTKYFITVTDTNNCKNKDSVMVFVKKLPLVDAGENKEICVGDTIQLAAACNCLQPVFAWNNPVLLSDDSVANPFAFPADTTVFTLKITGENGCSDFDTVSVFVNPLPVVSATSPTDEICIGDSVPLTAGCNCQLPAYTWSTGETTASISLTLTATTTLYVTVTDVKNCTNKDSIQIEVNALPIVDAGIEINSCKNSAVILGGSPTAPDSSVFLWMPSGNLNDATLANPTATPDTTTTYYVNVTDSNGCKNVDSTVVSIFSVLAISDTSFCKGETVQLFVTPVSATKPVTYLWFPELGSATDSMVIVSPDSNMIYTVIVTDAKGCSETKTISLVANNPPVADFEFVLSPSCYGVLAEFKNKSSPDAISFQWLLGNDFASAEENVTHIFAYEQLMTVSLIAFNDFCKNEKSYNEAIKNFISYFNLTTPNVFTPNNDGQNDCFEMDRKNNLQKCSELRVFNRWGEVLYISAGNQHRWCGKNFAGEEVPAGTYFYTFDINGILFKGAITLLR